MKIYNSLSGEIEEFSPINKNKVLMYVCGITPYDTTHLGHAFTYASFDVLARFLKFKGYNVFYTQNVTDVDDDILKKAKEFKKNWVKVGNFWTKKYLGDMKKLNVLPPTNYVKATGSIQKMIQMTKKLLKKEFAYQRDGNIYFDIKKFKNYGELSSLNNYLMLKLLKERGGNPFDPLKKDPLDFCLWQESKPNEPWWESPWGKGRPGWHIECSAMINQFLGDQIDIHGGGVDIKFPHHDCEIAQSESYTGKKPFVKYWMHTGTVLYQGEKMAKSLGNLIMLDDLFRKYSSNTIRFVLVSHHYRSPWEYNEREFSQSQKSFSLIENALNINPVKRKNDERKKYFDHFVSFMENDIDTPGALSLIETIAKEIIENKSFYIVDYQLELKKILEILGFRIQFK